MLNRMQVSVLVFAGLFGLCAMIGLVWLLSYLIETDRFGWSEMVIVFATIIGVVLWISLPEYLNLKRTDEVRQIEEQRYRDHVARLRENHMDHLKLMAQKQSKPIETYKFINDLKFSQVYSFILFIISFIWNNFYRLFKINC